MTEALRTLFAAVLTVSLGSSAVILLMTAFRRPLRRLRAGGRYLLWLLIILRLALPVTLPLSEIGMTLSLPTLSQAAGEDDLQAEAVPPAVTPSMPSGLPTPGESSAVIPSPPVGEEMCRHRLRRGSPPPRRCRRPPKRLPLGRR